MQHVHRPSSLHKASTHTQTAMNSHCTVAHHLKALFMDSPLLWSSDAEYSKATTLPRVSKTSYRFSSTLNFERLEPSLLIFGTRYPENLSFLPNACIISHNILSRVATDPENTLAPNRHTTCFPLGGWL